TAAAAERPVPSALGLLLDPRDGLAGEVPMARQRPGRLEQELLESANGYVDGLHVPPRGTGCLRHQAGPHRSFRLPFPPAPLFRAGFFLPAGAPTSRPSPLSACAAAPGPAPEGRGSNAWSETPSASASLTSTP